jgi:hypothetical protein
MVARISAAAVGGSNTVAAVGGSNTQTAAANTGASNT